jgi:hypothetical protein
VEAVPLHEPIVVVTLAAMVLGGLALLGAVTYFKLWGPLWRDWFTTVDHKKIGIMYGGGAGHAGAWLRRRADDARAAGRLGRAVTASCRRSTTTRSSPRTA